MSKAQRDENIIDAEFTVISGPSERRGSMNSYQATKRPLPGWLVKTLMLLAPVGMTIYHLLQSR